MKITREWIAIEDHNLNTSVSVVWTGDEESENRALIAAFVNEGHAKRFVDRAHATEGAGTSSLEAPPFDKSVAIRVLEEKIAELEADRERSGKLVISWSEKFTKLEAEKERLGEAILSWTEKVTKLEAERFEANRLRFQANEVAAMLVERSNRAVEALSGGPAAGDPPRSDGEEGPRGLVDTHEMYPPPGTAGVGG